MSEEPIPSEGFLINPGIGSDGKKKPIDVGLQETATATAILQMIEALPPKTAGVAAIKKGAKALLKSGAAKVAEAE